MPRELIVGLGRRIRERRLALDMKQETLAKKSGIAKSYLSQIETTEGASPSAIVLYHIAAALETTIPYLLDLPDQPATRVDTRTLPPGLAGARTRYALTQDEVALLAKIEYRGKRPQTSEDWFFLACAIRRTIG